MYLSIIRGFVGTNSCHSRLVCVQTLNVRVVGTVGKNWRINKDFKKSFELKDGLLIEMPDDQKRSSFLVGV